MIIGYEAKRYFHNSTGLGNYARSLVNNLAKYYPQHEFILYNPRPSNSFEIPLEFGNEIHEIRPEGFINKKLHPLWRSYNVSKRLKNDHLDLFHGLSGEIPRNIPDGISKVLTIHDLIFLRFPDLYNPIDRTIYYHKFKRSANEADLVVAISEQTKKDIIKYLGVSESKIKVIYQGCRDIFKLDFDENEIQSVKLNYNLPKDFILYVGTIEKRKNLLSIVQAIKNIDTHLVVVGRKTKYYNEVESYIQKNNLEKKVIFLNHVNDSSLAIIYKLAKVFLLPSFFEGFGIPIIEALYSGTPVITSKGGCLEEAGGPHSVYVEPSDVNSIKEAIINVLSDPKLRSDMISKGLKYSKNFDDDLLVRHWFDLYKSLI
ncbi:mannosyltransferase, putative [Psychroflexus torquis ATCC 700755]|uniref:Mannosyltransferase, putative n=1 Tax=Psychroflexus torquis (strain ATCC 700755 / CIP 106069 / ACAM 623) TaxID=313595 RepID=K4IB51_PSYTT|nr:glycosyltransferase family 1 protein [Psychroflexus torquis]AFU67654.1 mannosyltransferase, putative [Psychroflexus torquis ATCC 700755]